MWVFADSINANPVSLVILSALAVLLMINMLSARKNRRAVEQKKREIDEMRESLGDIDNTDQRDKYYF
jgi:type II secretory pathway component PulJ